MLHRLPLLRTHLLAIPHTAEHHRNHLVHTRTQLNAVQQRQHQQQKVNSNRCKHTAYKPRPKMSLQQLMQSFTTTPPLTYPHPSTTSRTAPAQTVSARIRAASDTVLNNLTPTERALFAVILQHLASKPDLYADTHVRVAGGWVRDKLRGEHTEDIDLVLDNIPGVDYANQFRDWLFSRGIRVSGMGTIKSNPEQSKHLDTATFMLDGMSIDMNSFRNEVYTGDSRIPQITRGTALEDSERRDFTVNSMYFNINTALVEDWTGMGLPDFDAKVLRTPVDANVTFADDPLRVLRAARFSGRLGFTVHDGIVTAAQSATVQRNLVTMVSRERVGIEVYKMVQKLHTAVHCFELLSQWKLRPIVLQLPDNKQYDLQRDEALNANIPDGVIDLTVEDSNEFPNLTDTCMHTLKRTHMLLQPLYTGTDQHAQFMPNQYAHTILSAYICTYYGYRCVLRDKPQANKAKTLLQYIVMDSLKLSTDVSNHCSLLINTSHDIVRLAGMYARAVANNDAQQLQAVHLQSGHMLRAAELQYVLAVQLAVAYKLSVRRVTVTATPHDADISSYINWLTTKSQLVTQSIWTVKPFMAKKALTDYCKQRGIEGQKIGEFTAHQTNFQISNPSASADDFNRLLSEPLNGDADGTDDGTPNKLHWSVQQFKRWLKHNTTR